MPRPTLTLADAELPSHLTAAQAARLLQVSKQTTYRRSLRGEPMESEPVLGTDMIPTHKVLAYRDLLLRRRRRCATPSPA